MYYRLRFGRNCVCPLGVSIQNFSKLLCPVPSFPFRILYIYVSMCPEPSLMQCVRVSKPWPLKKSNPPVSRRCRGAFDHGSPHIARIKRERSRKLHAGAETEGIPVHCGIQHIRHRHALWLLSWRRGRCWAHLLLLLLLLGRCMCRVRRIWVRARSILAFLALTLLLV